MSFLHDGFFPFCPTEMDETQFGNWNATNRSQWIGPLSLENTVKLYWLARKALFSIPSSPNSKFVTLNSWTWDGSIWGFPVGPDIDIQWPASEAITVPAIRPRASTDADGPGDFACGIERVFLVENATSVSSTDFVYDQLRLDIFPSSAPQGTGLTSVRVLLRIASGEYYIPISANWRPRLDPNQYEIESFGSNDPPPPDPKYANPTSGHVDENISFESSNMSYFVANRPRLLLNIMGASNILTYVTGASDFSLADQDLQITIDETDPAYFFTP